MTHPKHRAMYVKDHPDGVTIKVKVIPRASRTEIGPPKGDALTIKLTSPPVEGRANRDLRKFLGKKLGVAPSSISILRGQNSREKVLLVPGVDRLHVEAALE